MFEFIENYICFLKSKLLCLIIMKKSLGIYFLIGGLAIFVLVIIIKALSSPEPAQSPFTQAPPPLGVNAPNVNVPPYAGEAIPIIGTDPIISELPEEAVERQKGFLAELAATLAENQIDYDGWIAVGIHKKFFNNYIGARDAWEYAKLIEPNQPKTYLNLGNLYAYYLRDLRLAEENFLAATQRDISNSSGSYHTIANFYRDFDNREKAIHFYRKILAIDPNDQAAKVELGRLGVIL